MPLFEFQCRRCAHRFERLVRGTETPRCPSCQAEDLERLLTSFAVNSAARSHQALQGARRALTESRARHDERQHQSEELRNHLQEDCGVRLPTGEN